MSMGMMSHHDILEAMRNGEMCIHPFDPDNPDKKRLTPSGFNFSFTEFIVSVNQMEPFTIMERPHEEKPNTTILYFSLPAGDTALALTRESIWVSGSIGGTFHSKVSYAAQGLGQISTTLDPGWQGQLLISMNNPNVHNIDVVIGEREQGGSVDYKSFITLCLFRLINRATYKSDNTYARLELIEKVLQKNESNEKKIQTLLGKISALKTEVETLRIIKNLNLSCDNASQKELLDFRDIHDNILRMLDSMCPKTVRQGSNTRRS